MTSVLCWGLTTTVRPERVTGLHGTCALPPAPDLMLPFSESPSSSPFSLRFAKVLWWQGVGELLEARITRRKRFNRVEIRGKTRSFAAH